MGAEKVGFSFEFGLKGDKEVKASMQELFGLMSGGGSAAEKAVGAIGKIGSLIELGRFATPIGIAARALYDFSKASLDSGENIRQVRVEMQHLQRVNPMALSDSDLASNMTGVEDQFARLGLDAGNAFQLSFKQRFGEGIKNILWDTGATVDNLFTGAKIPSRESMSSDAKNVIDQYWKDQTTGISNTRNLQAYTTSNNNADLSALLNTNEVLGRHYIPPEEMNKWLDSKPNIPGAMGASQLAAWSKSLPQGVLPESYQGQKRLREIEEQRDVAQGAAIPNRIKFLQDKITESYQNGAGYAPGSNYLQDWAKWTGDIASKTKEIQELTKQQITLDNDRLEIVKDQRQADREVARNQNYGTYRTLGLGGVGFHDQPSPLGHGLNAISAALGGHRGRVSSSHFGMGRLDTFHVSSDAKVHIETLKSIDKNIKKTGIPTIKN